MHMSPNHLFVSKMLSELGVGPGARVLDYGCGAGEVVQLAMASGYDAYGVDVFYEGGSYKEDARRAGLLGGRVEELVGTRAPFADGYFDAIVSNQVLEHVHDLDVVVQEIGRLLKKDGVFLTLFPSRSVLREGHVGIPLLHRFPKRARWRVGYALLFRMLGLGYFKEGKGRVQWARDAVGWVDQYTYYRPWSDIRDVLNRRVGPICRLEPEYLSFRGPKRGPLRWLLDHVIALGPGRQAAIAFVTLYAGLVLAVKKV